MKTFGELVKQLKSGLFNLYDSLSNPGESQPLGPAYAYGQSFLVSRNFKLLQEAISRQEKLLKDLAINDNSIMNVSDNGKLWRVVDSIFQSLSLIDRYAKDPSKSSHQGVTEWLKQEASNCGLSSTFLGSDFHEDGIEEIIISFSSDIALGVQMDSKGNVLNVYKHLNQGNTEENVELLDVKEFFEAGKNEHISHLISIATRLCLIEDGKQSLSSVISSIPTELQFKLSLGGYSFQFIDGYDAILTFDTFEQNKMIPMIVIDPPIVFPSNQLKELSNLCGQRLTIENSLTSTPLKIMKLNSDVTRKLNDKSIRLILNDENIPSILLARVPLANLNAFDSIINILKKATTWCQVIKDTFDTNENIKEDLSIDIAPTDNFMISVTYWVQDSPEIIQIEALANGTLKTNDEMKNAQIGCPTKSFSSIIYNLIN